MPDDPDTGMLSWDETVFRNERVFEIDHIPETFKHRDTQVEKLKYALRPATRGSRPLNALIRGPPGTGKTTAIRKLFDELATVSEVSTIRINCQVNDTRYSVFSRLFRHIFEYEPPKSGVSFKKLFSQITDRLVENDEVLIAALDDVNYLYYENEASDTLYSLLRAHEEQGGARIGVIVVSSDPELDPIDELDTRVQSVFRPEKVYFPTYGESEIVDILSERVERGFHDGVLRASELDQVATYTADSGDLRVGLDLLRRAGLNAEMRGSKTIAEQDIEKAYETAKYVHLDHSLQALSESERALLDVIADNEGQRAGNVYDVFHEQTELGYTRYSEILNKLEELGIVETEYANLNGRGRSRAISLAYDSDVIRDRLDSD